MAFCPKKKKQEGRHFIKRTYCRTILQSLASRESNGTSFTFMMDSNCQPFPVKSHRIIHGLRTPNEGINRDPINQRYLKNWADVADKICFCRT